MNYTVQCAGVLILLLWPMSVLGAEFAPDADGRGEIESMEQQSIMIDGRGFDVSRATIQAVEPGEDGQPRITTVGRVSGSTPVAAVLPRGVGWVAYDLATGAERRIKTLWIPASANSSSNQQVVE